MEMELPPIKFVVENFLPQGFHILAGTPKVGKSWLLLSLCLQVFKGEDFWKMPVKQGSVLYLCLEDSVNRIQQRLFDLTENAPDNLHFATHSESLSGGITEQIEMFIKEHSDTVLIVIDTLQKIRDVSGEGSVYAADYKDIGMLKEIADKYSVTSLRKSELSF
ncbi:MAG: helicase RepA family protein [Eubacterium sp.]|nr:helicase RepA family protein [Eubacterium sp.]